MKDVNKIDRRHVSLPERPAAGSPADLIEREAHALVQAEIEAISEAELFRLNVHIPRATTRVLGVATHLSPYRARILAMPDFQPRHFDLLPIDAREVRAAHLAWLSVSPSRTGLRSRTLRKVLTNWRVQLRPLVQRGVIPADLLVAPEGYPTNDWVAGTALKICMAVRARWDAVAATTTLTEKQVAATERAAARLLDVDPARVAHDARLERCTLHRAKAFLALFRAYDQVRRAMSHIRWAEGDVDDLAPSLHLKRGARGKKKSRKGSADAKSADLAAIT